MKPSPSITSISLSASRWLTLFLLPGLLALTGCLEPEEDSEQVLIIEVDEDQPADTTDMSMVSDMGAPDMPQPPIDQGPPMFACEGTSLSGSVYLDTNLSSRSRFAQTIEETDELLADEDIVLIGENSTITGKTCADGTFGISGLTDGRYIMGATHTEGKISASSSQGNRFIQAVQEGELNVVVFGDSIPVYGPKPWYPTLLEQTLDTFADTDVINIAREGTQSVDWLPGTTGNYYDSILKPRVAAADVIVFSLGGNDLYDFANTNMDLSGDNLAAALEEFDAVIAQIIGNLKIIITQIRQDNPTADIVWMLYPNYATSDQWKVLAPDYIDVIANLLRGKLNTIRKELAHHEGLLIWDMLRGTDTLDLDDYLFDPLHLNVRGHVWWSQELFLTLGGVIIKDGVSVDNGINAENPRLIGLGLPGGE